MSAAGGRLTTQALVDLVLDPEEHGYREAARRNDGTPRRHWYDPLALAGGCAVIGFVLAVAGAHAARGAPAEAQAHAALATRVRAAEQHVGGLSRDSERLSTRLDRMRSAALPDDAPVLRDLDRSRTAAGLVAVSGPGLRVTLSEPSSPAEPTAVPGGADRTPVAGDHILTDRDLRSVVNQLWSDGAEAIAVNGIRLGPLSAIRFAGDAVLVDFRPIASPYTVDAVGDAARLVTSFANSAVASRYQTLASARGIGFAFSEESRLQLPAVAAPGLLYAVPGTAAPTARPSGSSAPGGHR